MHGETVKSILYLLLQNVSLQATVYLWFLYGVSPQHFLLSVRKLLPKVFREQRIGQGGPTFWSARFSDLNPLEFFIFVDD
jgi:hypothetical protein